MQGYPFGGALHDVAAGPETVPGLDDVQILDTETLAASYHRARVVWAKYVFKQHRQKAGALVEDTVDAAGPFGIDEGQEMAAQICQSFRVQAIDDLVEWFHNFPDAGSRVPTVLDVPTRPIKNTPTRLYMSEFDQTQTRDLHVDSLTPLVPPDVLRSELPLTLAARRAVLRYGVSTTDAWIGWSKTKKFGVEAGSRPPSFDAVLKAINWPLVALLAILSSFVITYAASGPQQAGDTMRYLNGADELLASGDITGKAASYSGYVLLVAAVKVIVPDPELQKWMIVAVQGLVQVLALLCLYSIGGMLFSKRTGLLAASLFAVNFYSLRWTPYILTESLFVSFIVISCWFCTKALRSPTYILPAMVVAAYTVSIRPNGLAMIPVFMVFFLIATKGVVRMILLSIVVVALVASLPVLIQALNKTAGHEKLIQMLESGTVISQTKSVEMPVLDQRSGRELSDVMRYVVVYPVSTLRLAGLRLYSAWSWQRSDYSNRHRLFLAIVMPTIYLFSILGLVVAVKGGLTGAHLLVLLLILSQCAVIAISFANHDHRFIGYVMPLVFLFAANGGSRLWDRVCKLNASDTT